MCSVLRVSPVMCDHIASTAASIRLGTLRVGYWHRRWDTDAAWQRTANSGTCRVNKRAHLVNSATRIYWFPVHYTLYPMPLIHCMVIITTATLERHLGSRWSTVIYSITNGSGTCYWIYISIKQHCGWQSS